MIAQLRGKLLVKQPPVILLDVNGVGYEVEAPMSTFYVLPTIGQELVIHTHMVVREDAQLLYGFASLQERSLFRSLIKVNGVGAKLALTILSGVSVTDFSHYVMEDNSAALVRLPGIGKKTAERLIIEMRDRIGDVASLGDGIAQTASVSSGPDSPLADAVSALIGLGYKPQDASRMVRQIGVDGLASEEIIRRALQAAIA
ncbi:MAG: Holliday junction branch migration protein RuvA [Gammaproteobacteria bacterium]|nr:Holliday junction branch migration protein RuvA [Gammaproteobacteria bacterium]PCH64805.1 MAG: Holliday junction branch migration protein RuvA [Gammaproteobacteria bacterium]